MRFDRKSRSQHAKVNVRPLEDAASRNASPQNRSYAFGEVQESHQAALRLGGLEHGADVLRDSEDLAHAAYEILPFHCKVILLSRSVCTVGCAPHYLHYLDNVGYVADRSMGGDNPRRLACFR